MDMDAENYVTGKQHVFLLYCNKAGFVTEGNGVSNDIAYANVFPTRQSAEKKRTHLYTISEYKNAKISIMEWL